MAHTDDLGRSLTDFGTVIEPFGEHLREEVVFGRDRELRSIEQRFEGAGNRSFILRGPSGGGKSAVLQEFFGRLFRKDSPWRALKTSTSLMLAGTRYSGELETRIKKLIDLVQESGRVLLYYSDPHLLMQAGRTVQDDSSVGSFLAPFVENGDVIIVGECTAEEYRRGFEAYDSFRRLFPAINIDETTPEETMDILQQFATLAARKWLYADSVELEYHSSVLRRIHDLAGTFLGSEALPGRSVHLLKLALSQLKEDVRAGVISAEPAEREAIAAW